MATIYPNDDFDSQLEEHYRQEELWNEECEAERRRGHRLVDAECAAAKSMPSKAATDRALMFRRVPWWQDEVIEFDLSGLPTQLPLTSS